MAASRISIELISVLILLTIVVPNSVFSGDVICTMEDYVLTGIEFGQCQAETLKSFASKGMGNPCPEIKQIIDNCAVIVKRCFNARGWQRGRQVFIALLALQYPDHNSCDVFVHNNKTDIPQKLEGEKCSIDEEVAALPNMRICNNQAQNDLVKKITTNRAKMKDDESYEVFDNYFAYPELCRGLANVSKNCFENNLKLCYDEADADFHYHYMLEELKIAGTMLATHIISNHNRAGVDVVDCPIFNDSVIKRHTILAEDNVTIVVLAVVLSLVILSGIMISLALAIYKFRLLPRIRAWLGNEPYSEHADNSNEMSAVPPSGEASDRVAIESAQEELSNMANRTRSKSRSNAEQSMTSAIRDQLGLESGAPGT